MFRQHRTPGGSTSRHKHLAARAVIKIGGITVNAISLFGSAATPAAWVEIFLGLSALTMFSTVPDWQSTSRAPRTAPAWLPVGGLLGLAAASVITGLMQPELFAAAFGQI